jgi:hypothetical protein
MLNSCSGPALPASLLLIFLLLLSGRPLGSLAIRPQAAKASL